MKIHLASLAVLALCLSVAANAEPVATTRPATQPTSRPVLSERQRQVVELLSKQDIALPGARLTRDGDIDPTWMKAHQGFVKEAKTGNIRLLFIGDSITAGWRGQPKLWEKYFGAYAPANFGIGGDRTQNVLWRLQNGELDGSQPQVVVLMIGTNNIGSPVPKIAEGIQAIVQTIRKKLPQTKILLLGIFPRGFSYHDGGRRITRETNKIISKLHDGQFVHYMDLTPLFVQPDGTMPASMFDKMMLHPTSEGYVVWGEAIKPKLQELMAK